MSPLIERLRSISRSVVFLIGLLLSLALYFALGGVPPETEAKINSLKQENTANETKLQANKEKLQNKAKIQEEMERISLTFRLALEYLPKELDSQDLLKKIYGEARAAGVELTHFVPDETVSKDFYDELPMKIMISGTYPQLLLFLANVSKIHRIINIRDVILDHPTLIDGYPTLDLKGTLVGYRYREGK